MRCHVTDLVVQNISDIVMMVLLQVTNMKEIILIGSYQVTKQLSRFITSVQQEFKIVVR